MKRETVFTFRAGKPVFELTDPEGHVYRMQSYSQIVNKKETLDDLAGLGAKLKTAEGLDLFHAHPRQGLRSPRHRLAYVVQDDFLNTYQRLPKP